MTQEEMLALLEEEYLAKIMGFCYKKVGYPDAEDLASDITLEVLKYIYDDKPVKNFNALVWSISKHTFCKLLRRKKYGNTIYLPMSISPMLTEPMASDNVEEEILRREKESLLRREIALLPAKHRKTIIMHYFDGMGCEQIAEILEVSIGTVKWWLHITRSSMKEGMDMTREYGKKSYRPESLRISCQGTPGADNEPMSCVQRKVPQNILLSAYEHPVAIQELCIELGISAPYVEDEVQNLVKNQLMAELPGGKFRTDFIILPNNKYDIINNIYAKCFPAYFDLLMGFLEENRNLLTKEDLNIEYFSWERLLWVYIPVFSCLVLDLFKANVCQKIGYGSRFPLRPNGGEWIAFGFHDMADTKEKSDLQTWKEYIPWDGPLHRTGKEFVQGYFHYWSGPAGSIFFELPDGVFSTCEQVIRKEIALSEMTEEEKFLFAIAMEKNLIVRKGTQLHRNYYFVKREGFKQLEELARKFYPFTLKYFQEAWEMILEKIGDSIPKDLHWQSGNVLSNTLNCFVSCSLYEAVKKGLLSQPGETGREWISLFVSRQ